MAEVNEAKREKSQVEDINRSLYDFRYPDVSHAPFSTGGVQDRAI